MMALEKNRLSDEQLTEVIGGRGLFSQADRFTEEEKEERKKREQREANSLRNRPQRMLS